jgi:hypothetical protein
MPLPKIFSRMPKQLISHSVFRPGVGSALPVGVRRIAGLSAATMIPSKLALNVTVPDGCPGLVQAMPNGPVQPWNVILTLPAVVVLKTPAPLVDVQIRLWLLAHVRVPPLPLTLKLVVRLRCQLCADATAGKATVPMLTTNSPITTIFLLMLAFLDGLV